MESWMQERYIRFDWAMMRLLRKKDNFCILEGFLKVLLNEPIAIVDIRGGEGDQLTYDEKIKLIDIKARNSQEDSIFVRVEIIRILHYYEYLYAMSKGDITEHINLGDAYSEVKKVYSISILYFDLGVGSDFLYHGQNQFVGVHTHDLLQIRKKEQQAIVTRLPSEIFPEYILIRVNEFDKVAVTPLDEWVRYLKDGIISPDTKAPGLGEAREKLKYYSMTPKERHAYDEHLNAVMIQNDVLNTAKMEGRAEGQQEERIKNATNLKKLGVSPEVIAQATGLSLEEIAKL